MPLRHMRIHSWMPLGFMVKVYNTMPAALNQPHMGPCQLSQAQGCQHTSDPSYALIKARTLALTMGAWTSRPPQTGASV